MRNDLQRGRSRLSPGKAVNPPGSRVSRQKGAPRTQRIYERALFLAKFSNLLTKRANFEFETGVSEATALLTGLSGPVRRGAKDDKPSRSKGLRTLGDCQELLTRPTC